MQIRAQRIRWSCVPFAVAAGYAGVRIFDARGLFFEDFPGGMRGGPVMIVAQWMLLFVIAAAAMATVMWASLHAVLPSPRLFGSLVTHRLIVLPRAIDPSWRARQSVLLASIALALIAGVAFLSYL